MALLHERISMKNLWRISQNFLHTCHSSSILLCISSKNMWKICEEYVTVYCLKFYIISNKFKSVWIYLKLWRILLNTIEIWTNLKGLTNTKRSKMKNREKEREREFFMNMVGEKSKVDSQGYYHEIQMDICFDKCNRKNTTWKPASNDQYNFLNTA